MWEYLNQLDQALFLFINVRLANPVSDIIMPFVTADNFLRILYAIAMLLLLWKGNQKLRWMVACSVLVLLLTDQLSAGLLKPIIGRMRPCQVMSDINLLINCGAGKAMPSAHAANAFGQAVLFSWHYRKAAIYLYSFAFIVALSRVFVGVHYPGDIVVGAMIGGGVGWMVALLYNRIENRFPRFKTDGV